MEIINTRDENEIKMMMKKIFATGIIFALAQQFSFALNMNCTKGSGPGKEYKGSQTQLPNLKDRKILGVWKHLDFSGINISLEYVDGYFYYVNRDKYCNSGKFGEKLLKKGDRFYRSDNDAEDFYKIMPDGMFGRFDNQGIIDKFPVSTSLYPQ